MPRRRELLVEDILESIELIEDYTSGMNFEDFESDQKTVDAVVNNLENIGEASKNLPEDFKNDIDLNWSNIAGFRDFVVHQYFNVDKELVWNILETELSELKKVLQK